MQKLTFFYGLFIISAVAFAQSTEVPKLENQPRKNLGIVSHLLSKQEAGKLMQNYRSIFQVYGQTLKADFGWDGIHTDRGRATVKNLQKLISDQLDAFLIENDSGVVSKEVLDQLKKAYLGLKEKRLENDLFYRSLDFYKWKVAKAGKVLSLVQKYKDLKFDKFLPILDPNNVQQNEVFNTWLLAMKDFNDIGVEMIVDLSIYPKLKTLSQANISIMQKVGQESKDRSFGIKYWTNTLQKTSKFEGPDLSSVFQQVLEGVNTMDKEVFVGRLSIGAVYEIDEVP